MEQATAGLDLELYAGKIHAGPEGSLHFEMHKT